MFNPAIVLLSTLSGAPRVDDASVTNATNFVNTDVHHRSRGCLFDVSVILPSGATIALEGYRDTDTVRSLVARLSDHPELREHAFYAMQGSSYLSHELTLRSYNVQAGSQLRVLYCDAIPGGGDGSANDVESSPAGPVVAGQRRALLDVT